jgi:hypothetical protein
VLHRQWLINYKKSTLKPSCVRCALVVVVVVVVLLLLLLLAVGQKSCRIVPVLGTRAAACAADVSWRVVARGVTTMHKHKRFWRGGDVFLFFALWFFVYQQQHVDEP